MADLTLISAVLQRSEMEEEENLAQALKMSLQESIATADTKPEFISVETMMTEPTASGQQLPESIDAGVVTEADAPAVAVTSAYESALDLADRCSDGLADKVKQVRLVMLVNIASSAPAAGC